VLGMTNGIAFISNFVTMSEIFQHWKQRLIQDGDHTILSSSSSSSSSSPPPSSSSPSSSKKENLVPNTWTKTT
jgi:hypothetical protein